MTLKQVIEAIEAVGGSQPSVRTIVRNDIYKLNTAPDVRYGVFAWLQNTHTSNADSSLMRWNFTFFFVDRLTDGQGNQVEVLSTGIETLTNIIRALRGAGIWATDYSFNSFNQRFADECAGIFCSVTFETPVGSLCPEEYKAEVDKGSFNISYNASFDIAVLKDDKEIKII